MPVDILAIAAHRDDVELTCAGTLLKAVDAGLPHRHPGPHGRARAAPGAAPSCGPRRRSARPRCWASASGGTPGCPTPTCRTPTRRARVVVEQIRHFAPAGRDPPLPRRPAPRSPHRQRARPGRLLPGRPGHVRRRRRAAPAAQDPLRPLLPRGPGQADVRGGHHARSSSGRWRPSGATRASSTAPRRPARSSPPARTSTPWSRPRTPTTARSSGARYGEPFFTHETMAVDDVVRSACRACERYLGAIFPPMTRLPSTSTTPPPPRSAPRCWRPCCPT